MEELYQKYFDPLIQTHNTLTYDQFVEAFILSGLVDESDVHFAFYDIVDKEEMLDSVRIKQVVLLSMINENYNNR